MNDEKKEFFKKLGPILLQRDFVLEEKPLGDGSFGLVVEAKYNVDKQKYAIKVLLPREKDKEKFAKYQKRELELLTGNKDNLWGKNIVRYYHSWQDNVSISSSTISKVLFIQMELCLTNLTDFIYVTAGPQIIRPTQSRKPLWAQVFPQILNGLQAIHQIGWVHRDIHPGNILIANPKPQKTKDIVVKIADFGLAREIRSTIESSLDHTDAQNLPGLSRDIGHELFMAPELETDHYDYKVDLYSAGIVLYYLSRYLPKKEDWVNEIEKLRQDYRALQNLSHQDDILVQLIRRLIKENPKERPTAAKALEYINGETSALENNFLVKKQGDDTYYRCTTTDDTLKSLQIAVQEHSHIGISVNAQILKQVNPANEELLVGITGDNDVKKMFLSAEVHKKKVHIVVTDRAVQIAPMEWTVSSP